MLAPAMKMCVKFHANSKGFLYEFLPSGWFPIPRVGELTQVPGDKNPRKVLEVYYVYVNQNFCNVAVIVE